MNPYKKPLQLVQERINKACEIVGRNPGEITLVAVSKTYPNDAIKAVYDLGIRHFGENKVQELVPKMEELYALEDLEWHMIGTLQSNKIKYLTDRVNWIDSIPKLKALKEVEKRAEQSGRTIKTMVQVNISDEDQKSGCDANDLPKILEFATTCEYLEVRGLMGIASFTEDMELVGSEFRTLKKLQEQYKAQTRRNCPLNEVSMGMTNDLETAIACGSTMIRVGTAIFGSRNY